MFGPEQRQIFGSPSGFSTWEAGEQVRGESSLLSQTHDLATGSHTEQPVLEQSHLCGMTGQYRHQAHLIFSLLGQFVHSPQKHVGGCQSCRIASNVVRLPGEHV